VANFLGRLQTFLFGAAIGRAASDAITPVLEPVRQSAWEQNQLRVLDPTTAAELVAKRFITEAEGQGEAAKSGYAVNRFGALTRLAQTYPGLADVDKMSNRRIISPEQVAEILARHGVADEFTQAFVDLFQDLLSPAEVAAAVQQGHLPNETINDPGVGILPNVDPAVTPAQGAVTPVAPDQQPPSTVPLTQVDIDPGVEAAGAGIDLKRLEVLANLAGLPPGADTVLQMWNRNLIDEATVDAGIREGHLKTKWSAAFKRMRWSVLGAAEYASAHLRGWITQDEMYKGGALTGHTTDQMDLLYLNRGRPLAPVQAFTAWARAAPHPVGEGYTERPGTFDQEDFQRAIQQSDVRTEYGPILWHNRFAYPPLFQLGRLATAGAITEARVREILTFERYEPQDIDALVKFWYGAGKTATTATRAKSAQTQAITALKKSFMNGSQTPETAKALLEALGVDDTEAGHVLAYWQEELTLVEKRLTPAQIKKAYSENLKTRDDAIAELVAQHFSVADANTFLTI
jgi:hypothetical protein